MKFWYQSRLHFLAILLLPVSLLVWFVTLFKYYRRAKKKYPIAVLVVGNLTVGGTGKTPTIIWLVQQLNLAGIKAAVVSRGYGARPNREFPVHVQDADSAESVGDEPKLISLKTKADVVIDPDRNRAVNYLCSLPNSQQPDIIISDDGLQHYRMARDLEIIMVDPDRGLGNHCLLPAGPLRESRSRLQTVDYVLAKGNGALIASLPRKVQIAKPRTGLAVNTQQVKLEPQRISAISAIGNPESFYRTLESLGYEVAERMSFPDHAQLPMHCFSHSRYPIVITEKDQIKLTSQPETVFVLPFELHYDTEFTDVLMQNIKEVIR